MSKAKHLRAAWVLTVFCVCFASSAMQAAEPELISVNRIWQQGRHNAFTDLIRFRGQWLCTFREAAAHVGGDGKIRVLASADGDQWTPAALLDEPGVDLRDPKFSVTPDGRLMLSLGGSIYEGRTLRERQPRVAFSKDGREWSAPRRILEKGDWLWRVTWHDGHAYGISYASMTTNPSGEWAVKFVESTNGVDYRVVKKLDVPGRPNEATVRFLENGEAVALLRRESGDKAAWIGVSAPPFKDWKWHSAGLSIGGPNFIVLADGKMIAGGRQTKPAPEGPKMFLGDMTLSGVTPQLVLPSGGDCSYPGLVWHGNTLWVSYYSSHEGQGSIYLAQVKWPAARP